MLHYPSCLGLFRCVGHVASGHPGPSFVATNANRLMAAVTAARTAAGVSRSAWVVALLEWSLDHDLIELHGIVT